MAKKSTTCKGGTLCNLKFDKFLLSGKHKFSEKFLEAKNLSWLNRALIRPAGMKKGPKIWLSPRTSVTSEFKKEAHGD